MEPDTIELIGQLVAATTGGAGAIWSFWRFALKPILVKIRHYFNVLEKVSGVLEKSEEQRILIENEIKGIRDELTVNGGKSLRDAVNRIEDSIKCVQHSWRYFADRNGKPVLEADEDGMVVWANAAFLHLSGLMLEDVVNYGWLAAVYPSDRERVQKDWLDAVQERRIFQSFFHIRNIRTGELVSVKAQMYKNNACTACGYFLFVDKLD